jgi:hypothetical protein
MATSINQITAPRVDFLDQTGKISREWYMFLYNLYTITGAGTGITAVVNGGTGLGTIPTNGQLLIGNGTGYTLNTLGFGAGISVSNGSGSISISNTGVLSNIAGLGISVSNSTGNVTITNTGVRSWSGGTTGLTPAAATTGDVILAGKLAIANGGTNATAAPTAGAMAYGTGTAYAFTVAGTSGQVLTSAGAGTPTWTTPTVGTVTSVGLSLPAQFTVTNSPVTSSGTLTGSWNTQTANYVLAGPTAGAAAVPTFRALVAADIPALPYGTGDVVGPASATDNAVARFNLTTGKLIQNSVTTIDDTGNASGILSQQFSNGAAVTLAAGKMWYDGSTGAWNLGMGNGNITQQIGEEIFVYGKASAAITDSPLQIIYHTGVVGASGVIQFAPTVAGITDANAIIGIATESLALNNFGRATVFGVVRGITTNGTAFGETWADDDVIWYNPVTGNPTKVEPVAPYIKVQVGLVIKAGAGGSGSFQVNIARGSKLGGTDSNVQFGALANSNLIQYNSTLGYWTNVTPASVTGVGSVANAVTFNNGGAGAASGTTFDGSVARTISYNTIGAQVAGTYVTAVSVASANGLAGTSSGGATPALTLSTSITGILKGNGTAISAATSGTDYAPATSGTSILYGNGSGGFSNVTVGSGLSFSAGTLAATTSAPSAPVTQTANFSVAATDVWLINNKSGSTCTVTLPTASANSGRVLYFQNYQVQALVSASSNVVPLTGGAAATSILLASSGDSATLVSDGTNWLMTQYIPNNILLLE